MYNNREEILKILNKYWDETKYVTFWNKLLRAILFENTPYDQMIGQQIMCKALLGLSVQLPQHKDYAHKMVNLINKNYTIQRCNDCLRNKLLNKMESNPQLIKDFMSVWFVSSGTIWSLNLVFDKFIKTDEVNQQEWLEEHLFTNRGEFFIFHFLNE